MTMRPHQWVKNLFVLAPLIFAQKLSDPRRVTLAFSATLLFSLVSSAVYVFNDLLDREADRQHPVKRFRPLASGALSPRAGIVLIAALVFFAVSGGIWVNPLFLGVAATYGLLNVAYSARLKHIPFVDVTVIAVGFICRVIAGAVAIDVAISKWLLICTFLLAIFLGLGKRRHELAQLSENAQRSRQVLERYSLRALDVAMPIVGLLTWIAYVLYTVAAETALKFGTRRLIVSAPLIVIALFRFLQLARRSRVKDSPTDAMLRDPIVVGSALLWGATVIAVIYHVL
ncbi:MAG: decaprenyl-phosphate phosphoribosyltransferase [Myxococcales bacterium]|nr:decaprenyl-phosphate phosphoribosyltransferase [Myxococcales bacterium]